MKPIAVTVLPGSRTDFFWLKSSFEMYASSPKRGLGFDLNFGGVFTSVPAAVSAMAHRDLVASPGGGGGVVTGSVAAVSGAGVPLEPNARALTAIAPAGAVITGGIRPLTRRLDLFGLDPDYALVHKRFWGVFDKNDLLVPWQPLGGTFTSAPAAIAWAGNRVDVFGVGLDHAMYVKTAIGEIWTPQWARLGGTFTSAAALVSRGPKLLDLFARGADFTLRGNHTDGTTWFGFQNHGGELASPPVAVSWGPDRIDIFAVFKDGALWHRWWDGQIWNEWESLGGSYEGEPAAVTSTPGRLDVFVLGAEDRMLHHHVFSRETWRNPQKLFIPHSTPIVAGSPSVISTAANRLDLFVPMANGNIHIGKWNGRAWDFVSAGSNFRAPQRYRISVDFVHVTRTRALDADTDAAMVSVAAGNTPAKIKTQSIGTIGGFTSSKTAQTNLLRIEPVTVDLAEPMSFSYLVVNNGHASEEKIRAALANAGNSLSLAGSSSMQEDIARGVVKFIAVTLLGEISLSVPVVGSILKKAESWLLDQLIKAAFERCDGVVAVELRAMMGRDLYKMTDNGKETVKVTTRHLGTNSPSACGFNSLYEVTWSITPV